MTRKVINMVISIILAHPDSRSFNHAIAHTAVDTIKANGHKVFFHDLYQEKFDPLLPAKEINEDAKVPAKIKKHCEEIAAADGIVIVHPTQRPKEKKMFSAIRWKQFGRIASSIFAVSPIFTAGCSMSSSPVRINSAKNGWIQLQRILINYFPRFDNRLKFSTNFKEA
ncbi:MAG: NAD(P)H-dependent oxidoreductase [Smithella sp.]|jgi:hypothetical protein